MRTWTLTSSLPVECSISWAIRPTGSWLSYESMITPWMMDMRSIYMMSINRQNACLIWSNISNTRKNVLSDIQTLRSGLKNSAAPRFFNTLFSVWISDETPFLVFDIWLQIHVFHELISCLHRSMVFIFGFSNKLHGSGFRNVQKCPFFTGGSYRAGWRRS